MISLGNLRNISLRLLWRGCGAKRQASSRGWEKEVPSEVAWYPAPGAASWATRHLVWHDGKNKLSSMTVLSIMGKTGHQAWQCEHDGRTWGHHGKGSGCCGELGLEAGGTRFWFCLHHVPCSYCVTLGQFLSLFGLQFSLCTVARDWARVSPELCCPPW